MIEEFITPPVAGFILGFLIGMIVMGLIVLSWIPWRR